MKIEDSEFKNVTQHLDGNEFIRCNFIDSELVFSAQSPVTLVGCSFRNVRWTFAGGAKLTIQFMTALYHGAGEGGRNLIENAFLNIRKNRPFSPSAAE
jgi:hypothetical protein